MIRNRNFAVISLLVAAVFAVANGQQPQRTNPPQPNQPVANENKAAASPEAPKKTVAAYDAEAISNRLVTQVAGVKEGDVVFINGGVRDLELLENLNTDTRKVGAFPPLTISSDRMAKKYFEEVAEKYDTQPPDFDLKLATLPTVAINIDSNEAEGVLADVFRACAQALH